MKHGQVESPRAQYFPEIMTLAGQVDVPAPGIYTVELRAMKMSGSAPEGIGVSGVRMERAPGQARK